MLTYIAVKLNTTHCRICSVCPRVTASPADDFGAITSIALMLKVSEYAAAKAQPTALHSTIRVVAIQRRRDFTDFSPVLSHATRKAITPQKMRIPLRAGSARDIER